MTFSWERVTITQLNTCRWNKTRRPKGKKRQTDRRREYQME